jgi:RNA polymerase sigma factor (sigma-70 family)
MVARVDGAGSSHPLSDSGEARLLAAAQQYAKQALQRAVPDALLAYHWDEFYTFYDKIVRRTAAHFSVRQCDLDDLSQDVWLAVWTHLRDFQWNPSRPGLRAWFVSIVRAKVANQLRERYRRREQVVPNDLLPEDSLSVDQDDPAKVLDKHWDWEVLQLACEGLRADLSPESRLVFDMRVVQRKSVSEVAGAVGLPPERVRDRQRWLLRRLRARIGLYCGSPIGNLATGDAP